MYGFPRRTIYRGLIQIAVIQITLYLPHPNSATPPCASVLFETFAPASDFLHPGVLDFSEKIAAHQFCSRHSARHQIFYIQTDLIFQRRSLRISFVRDIRPGIRFFTSRHSWFLKEARCASVLFETFGPASDFLHPDTCFNFRHRCVAPENIQQNIANETLCVGGLVQTANNETKEKKPCIENWCRYECLRQIWCADWCRTDAGLKKSDARNCLWCQLWKKTDAGVNVWGKSDAQSDAALMHKRYIWCTAACHQKNQKTRRCPESFAAHQWCISLGPLACDIRLHPLDGSPRPMVECNGKLSGGCWELRKLLLSVKNWRKGGKFSELSRVAGSCREL